MRLQSRFADYRSNRFLTIWILLTFLILSHSGISQAAQEGPVPAFNDLEAATSALPYIQYLTNQGVINGFPDGSFRPWAAVTRAQMVKILVLALDLKLIQADQVTFPDVPAQHWASPYIESAAAAGLINGYPDGAFQPDAVVNRAEQAAMLFSFARYPVTDVPVVELDDMQPGHWAYAAVAAAVDAGLMGPAQGNSFMPNGASSRAGVTRNVALLTTMLPHNQVGVLEATLRPLEGKVSVTGKHGVNQIQGDVKIGIGDRVVTGSGSRAEIEFDDGSGLRLEPLTEVEIVNGLGSAFITADGQPGTAINLLELKLVRGRMVGALATRAPVVAAQPQQTASILERFSRGPRLPVLLAATTPVPLDEDWWNQDQPLYLPPGMTLEEWQKQQWWQQPYTKRVRVKVDMPWGVAGIRGTFWQNRVEGGKQSTEVLWGEAEVTAGGQTVPVTTGQHTEVTSAAEAPAPPRKIEVAEAQVWQEVSQWVVERAVVIEQKAPAKPVANQQLDTPVAPETARQQTSPPPPAPVPTPDLPQQPGTQPVPGEPPLPAPGQPQQPQQPVPGQPQQPAPGQPQLPGPGSLLQNLQQAIEEALENVGASPPASQQPQQQTGAGSGSGDSDDTPTPPSISLTAPAASSETSFVRLQGSISPAASLQSLQVRLNGLSVGNIPVAGGAFDYILYGLRLGSNSIELKAIDTANQTSAVTTSVIRTSSYIQPLAVLQPATGSISGSAVGLVNLEWLSGGKVQAGTVYNSENGSYTGMLPLPPGPEVGGLPPGELLLTEEGSAAPVAVQPALLSGKLAASGIITGQALDGQAGDQVEVLWYHNHQPAALANQLFNSGIIPDARQEAVLDSQGYYSMDLIAAGIPLHSGDVVAVLYPADAPVRTALAGTIVAEPQMLLTDYGISAVLPQGGTTAEFRLLNTANQPLAQLAVQTDAAGYATIARADLSPDPFPMGATLQLLEGGTQLNLPVGSLQAALSWQQGQLVLAVTGVPSKPVWVQASGSKPFWAKTGSDGKLNLQLPVPAAWGWQPEYQPQIRVIQQVGEGMFWGVQRNLAVVPGLELDLEESTAKWWSGQGDLFLPETGQQLVQPGGDTPVALAGAATLRSGLELQLGDQSFGSITRLDAQLQYSYPANGTDVGLGLSGQVALGQQVLVELGGGDPDHPASWRAVMPVDSGGGFNLQLPAGMQPDWVRAWAMGANGYRAFRQFYPWAVQVDQDHGLIQGHYWKLSGELLITVELPGSSQSSWEAATYAGPDGAWHVLKEDGIPAGSKITVIANGSTIYETVVALRSSYLDLMAGEIGAARLTPPRAVLARVDEGDTWWRLPESGANQQSWQYDPDLQLEASGGHLPDVVVKTMTPGGHQYQRLATILGMQVDLAANTVQALVHSPATTALLRWERSGQLLWIGQAAVIQAGGLNKAVFDLPGVLSPGDLLVLNGDYSMTVPELTVDPVSDDGIVSGSLILFGQPLAGETVEVTLVTYGERTTILTATDALGQFEVLLPTDIAGTALEVTAITANGQRSMLRWEPGEE